MSLHGMNRIQRTAVVAGALLVLMLAGYLVLYYRSGRVRFEDPGLQQAVREALLREDGDIYRSELERITNLDASYGDIQDLSGIELLHNLRILDLSGNWPSSLAPCARLENLEELVLRDAGLASLKAVSFDVLSRLPRLTSLDLSHNPDLEDGKELAAFESLQELTLRGTGINDLSPLARLPRLRRLDLRDTEPAPGSLQHLGGLFGLEHLNLRECGIRDLSPLSGLVNLRYLNLHTNPGVSSAAPLRELTQLRTLIMQNVPLASQLDVISGMHSLQRLNIRNTGVRDLSVLAELMRRGALQDDPNGGVYAAVDIRDNPIEGTPDKGPVGYEVLLPYWHFITYRRPRHLPRAPSRDLLINEAMSSNGSTCADEDGDYADWIELYNPGNEAADLGGWYLLENDGDYPGWRFPAGTEIPPQRFMLVWASGKNRRRSGAELHADFRLSSSGETVTLTASDRRTVVDRVTLPALPRDASYGRRDDGELAILLDPTPGEDNTGSREYMPVTFSHPGGFYEREFALVLSAPSDSAEIYYTLDGSVPDPEAHEEPSTYRVKDHETGDTHEHRTRTYRYTGPITIDSRRRLPTRLADIPTTVPHADFWYWQPPEEHGFHGTVVRAAVYDPDLRSHVHTESYFVASGVRERLPLGVVSLTAHPPDLFSYEKGIYVPGKTFEEARGFEGNWMRHPANYLERREIPVHIEFFEPDGFRGFSLDGGMRIHGGWSRSHPLKSLRLYARKDHDVQGSFAYPVFHGATERNGHAAVVSYKRLMLRSGQSLFFSHLQDAATQDHVYGHVEVELLRSRPVIHFINGEYWGMKNLRERFDRFYLEANYGVDPDTVIIVEGPFGFDAQLEEGKPGENRPYRELLRYVETHDMSQPEHYDHVRSLMDIGSFIDYHIVRIYSGDPDGVTKHIKVWRTRTAYDRQAPPGLDGRWRWHTWDFDNALRFLNRDTMTLYANDRAEEEHDSLVSEALDRGELLEEDFDPSLFGDWTEDTEPSQPVRNPRYTTLITGLLQNREFRHRFINRFADLLNTIYHPEVYAGAIREHAALIEAEIERHIARWRYPRSHAYWRSRVEQHVEFALQRPGIQRDHIVRYFSLRGMEPSGTFQLHVETNQEAGRVRVNSVLLEESTPGLSTPASWSGHYFDNIPVELEAVPADGCRFLGWSGDVPSGVREQRIIQVSSEEDLTLRAVFHRR